LLSIIIKNNYSKIAIANIIQQILSLITTSYLIKSIGSINYSNIVFFLVTANAVLMFLNCWINPFYIREASLEYQRNKRVNETLTTIFLLLLFITLAFIIYSYIGKINFISTESLYLLFFFILAQLVIYVTKLTFRIQNKINKYIAILIGEKFIFLISIIIYFYSTNLININLIIIILTLSYLFIAILFLFFLIQNYKFKIPSKIFVKDYIRNSTFILFATIFVFFTSYEYLIIILNNSEFQKIITYLAIGYMFSNLIYMPVYWLEQLIGPKINLVFNSNNNNYKIKYYKDIGLYFLYLCFFMQLIIINVLINTNILIFLFDNSFIENIYYVIIIIFVTNSKLIDTIFSIPIFAKKFEKKVMFFNIFKALIFLYFFLILGISSDNLIILFILLSFLQNFYYIYLNSQLVNNYRFKEEIIYLILTLTGFLIYLYTEFFMLYSLILICFLILFLSYKKLIIIKHISEIDKII